MKERANQIVWFFGQSGAGKATLIKKIVHERPDTLLQSLGLAGYDLKLCGESLSRISGRKLEEVIRELLMNAFNLAVLVKGQTAEDLNTGMVRRLEQTLPKCIHRIVFVWVELDEVYHRIRERGLSSEYWRQWTRDNCKGEFLTQRSHVDKLRQEFQTVCVDATNSDYRVRDWPKEDPS